MTVNCPSLCIVCLFVCFIKRNQKVQGKIPKERMTPTGLTKTFAYLVIYTLLSPVKRRQPSREKPREPSRTQGNVCGSNTGERLVLSGRERGEKKIVGVCAATQNLGTALTLQLHNTPICKRRINERRISTTKSGTNCIE